MDRSIHQEQETGEWMHVSDDAQGSACYVRKAVVEDEAKKAARGARVLLEPLLDDAKNDLLGVRARRLVEPIDELPGGQRRHGGGDGQYEEEREESHTGVHGAENVRAILGLAHATLIPRACRDGQRGRPRAERSGRRDERLSLSRCCPFQ
jgi:hypothetical protein